MYDQIKMDTRYASHPDDVKKYDTETLRKHFLIEDLFIAGALNLTYSQFDRIIVGGAMPVLSPLMLDVSKAFGVEYFLQRRELGVINIGEEGIISVDGELYTIKKHEGLYIGMGKQSVSFSSLNPNAPAKFYINSAPAHKTYPTVMIDLDKAKKVKMGTPENLNERTIYQIIHPAVLESCQLVMGMTLLEPGSVWNTMPTHTHERRMEVYMYFNMSENARVFHFMGQPEETRHLLVKNEQAIISPSWSIHSGVGLGNYAFIWGMVGENQEFTDMDHIEMKDLR